jgi:hypothetical protein
MNTPQARSQRQKRWALPAHPRVILVAGILLAGCGESHTAVGLTHDANRNVCLAAARELVRIGQRTTFGSPGFARGGFTQGARESANELEHASDELRRGMTPPKQMLAEIESSENAFRKLGIDSSRLSLVNRQVSHAEYLRFTLVSERAIRACAVR